MATFKERYEKCKKENTMTYREFLLLSQIKDYIREQIDSNEYGLHLAKDCEDEKMVAYHSGAIDAYNDALRKIRGL